MEEPQQYGIWDVSGLGLVIAFRGTASSEDVFIDVNIKPVPLTSAGMLCCSFYPSPMLQ